MKTMTMTTGKRLLKKALLGAGATYEQRVRDLRRVGRRVAGLS